MAGKSVIPEAELIEETIVLRDMRLPQDVMLTKRSLIRWIALSLGLISPNESRKSLIGLIEVLFELRLASRSGAPVDAIMERLRAGGKECSEKTVRYHLLRLERKGIVRRKAGEYSLVISDIDDSGIESIADSYEKRHNSAMGKVRMALKQLKGMY